MTPPLDLKILATSALAFAAAMSWNNAIEASIRNLYPAGSAKSAHVTAVYAIVVTVLVILIVMAINYLSRVAEKLHRHRGGRPAPEKASYTADDPSSPRPLTQMINVKWPAHWV
jgi:hypothetical protein